MKDSVIYGMAAAAFSAAMAGVLWRDLWGGLAFIFGFLAGLCIIWGVQALRHERYLSKCADIERAKMLHPSRDL